MRKFGILMSIVLCLPLGLAAQIGGARAAGSEYGTRATVFGGYSYLRNDSNGFNGWEGQGTFNFNRYLGVTADVSGSSLTPFSFSALGASASTYQHLTTYLFGPTVTASLGRSAVFAHALFGEARSSLGGGLNIPIIGGISTSLRTGSTPPGSADAIAVSSQPPATQGSALGVLNGTLLRSSVACRAERLLPRRPGPGH